MPAFWENDTPVDAPKPASKRFWENDELAEAPAAAGFDPAEYAKFKAGKATVPGAPGGFDPAEYAAFKAQSGPQASQTATSQVDRAIEALSPFFQKGVSTRNSAGQWTGEARALLTKAGLNPDTIDQKAERGLLASYEDRSRPTGGGANSFARGVVDGIPIAGPYLLGGISKADAFVRAVQNGTSYSEELRKGQHWAERTDAAAPWSKTAGEVIGGIVGTAPLVAAAPAAFGAAGGSLALRAGTSALSSGALGSADAAVRSDGDIGETAKGAALGTAFGLGGPLAGAAIGKGVRAAASVIGPRSVSVPGAGNATASRLAEDLRNSGGADTVRARLAELGEEAMLLDASPSLTGRAQGLAVRPETRETIVRPLEVRNEATNQRVREGIDAALGEAPVPSQVEAQFAARRRAAGPMFEEATNSVPAVDANAPLAEIAARLETASGAQRAALLRARDLLAEEGANGALVARTDPRYLHDAKRSLDELIDYGDPTIGVPRGAISRTDGALAQVRRSLNNALEEQVPGYADANLAYRTAARASEALESGKSVLGGGSAAIHPEDFAADLARRPIEQQAALRAGVRADLDRAVGNSANDLQAVRKQLLEPDDWNRQKLNATFGDEAVNDAARVVDTNQTFRDNYSDIVRNSQTAQRTASANDMSVRDLSPKSGDTGIALSGLVGGRSGVAAAIGMKGLRLGANAAGRASDLARNREAASILTMRAGPERDALIEALQNRLAAASRGEAPAAAMDRFVSKVLQSQNDRSERRALPAR